MSNGIFTLQSDNTLVELVEAAFDSEDVFQELIARYPKVVAGEQIDPEVPRRWVLVTREASVPDELNGSGRWSLDHLLLDQDGIPTLVEVKRSTDTRLRREIVGQMLDYAANGVVYWPEETIRAMFESECATTGRAPDDVLRESLGTEDAASYWGQVKTNLQAGRIRMLFVADIIPPELRRVVEFLNEQMDPAEVLALELKQYRGGDLQTLVPRVYGQTAAAARKQTRDAGKTWDESTFMAALRDKRGESAAAAAHAVLAWAKARGFEIWWGKGSFSGSFFPVVSYQGRTCLFAAFWTYGTVEMQFQHMKGWKPFDDESVRRDLCRQLNSIPGVSIPEDRISFRPGFPITVLSNEDARHRFLEILESYFNRVREAAT